MLNTTADLLTDFATNPYIKFGIGTSRNKADQYS